MRHANAKDIYFTRVALSNVDYTGADFTNARFIACSLKGADLSAANLTNVRFVTEYLKDWSDTGRFGGTLIYEGTKFPDGFQLPDNAVMARDLHAARALDVPIPDTRANRNEEKSDTSVVVVSDPDPKHSYTYVYTCFPDLFTRIGNLAVATSTGRVMHMALNDAAKSFRVDATGQKLSSIEDKWSFACAMATSCLTPSIAEATVSAAASEVVAASQLTALILDYAKRNRGALKKEAKLARKTD
jgi:uncharacterized protein YjbI with pentapeptide repeats